MKRKYYPNKWGIIKNTPVSYFPSLDYEDFEDWKIHGYQLPSAVYGIIRAEDEKTGAIEEFTYRSVYHAHERLKKCFRENKKVILATMEGVWHIKSKPAIDFNNP